MTDHGYGDWIEDRDQEAAAKAGMTLSDWRAARQHEKRMARGHALLLKHKADEADIAYYRQHETPADEHPDDIAVDRFAAAMKAKLAKKRADGRGGWQDKDGFPAAVLGHMLREHVEKGDPVDVANFCMMAHQRSEPIAAPAHPAPDQADVWQDKLGPQYTTAWRIIDKMASKCDADLAAAQERIGALEEALHIISISPKLVHLHPEQQHERCVAIARAALDATGKGER